MKRQGQFRYSETCQYKCIPRHDEDIYEHEDTHDVRHQYIRDKHFDEHFKKYEEVVRKWEKKVEGHRDGVMMQLRKIKEEIERIEENLNGRTKQYLSEFQIGLFQGQEDRQIMLNFKQKKYEGFTCKEMHRLITMTDTAHLQPLQKRTKDKIDQHILDIQQQMQRFLKRAFEDHRIPAISESDVNLLNMIKLTESSIVKAGNESVISEGLMDFKIAFDQCFQVEQKPVKNMAKKQQNDLIHNKQNQDADFDSLEIVEDDHDTSYYQRNKELVLKGTDPADNIKPSIFKIEEKKEHNHSEMTKAFTDRESEQSKEEHQPQENEQQIMKDIHSTQTYINSSQSHLKDSQDFIEKISGLQYIAEDIQLFNIKVKVVRVLYFCVVMGTYLKTKFIAGDETGIAVFFTNYSKIIKPNAELELTNCKIKCFKEALEVVNDRHFRAISIAKQMIKVNQNGYIFTKGIEKDLYYKVYDKNCQLIREVAQRLRKKNNFTVSKMIVQVAFILNEWTDKLFCQVGDSSGLMLAYLKKDKMVIKEGDVVTLRKITAKKGPEPNKLMNEDIIYLDTFDESAQVTPFRHDFLELSDTIMSA